MAEIYPLDSQNDEPPELPTETTVIYVNRRLTFGQFVARASFVTLALGTSLAFGAKFGIQWGTEDTRDDLAVTQARLLDAQAEANQLEGTVADLIAAAETANLGAIGRQAEIANAALDRLQGVYYCPDLQPADLHSPTAIDNWCEGAA